MPIIQATTTQVEAFAVSVRAALADLPADEVDELTEGLEADLFEQASDEDAPPDALGDPVAYAEELRAAAGLPSRPARESASGARASIPERAVASWRDLIHDLRGTSIGAGALDFLIALRPVWWVLRGWAFYFVLAMISFTGSIAPVPTSGFGWIILITLVVVSVQWGRAKWLPKKWIRGARLAIGIAAAVSLLFAVPVGLAVAGSTYSSAAFADDDVDYAPSGLSIDGNSVGNIFAYDSDGEPLTDVQLFDQSGRPLDLVGVDGDAQGWYSIYDLDGNETTVVPSDAVPGRVGWNVYPLKQSDSTEIDYTTDPQGSIDDDDTRAPEPPFSEVQALARRTNDVEASDRPSPSPDASTAPSASPAPSGPPIPPTPSASPTP